MLQSNLCRTLSMATAGAAAIVLGTVASSEAAILGGQLYGTGGKVTVEILPSSAAFTNILELVSPSNVVIGNNKDDVGKIFDLGSFANNVELIFGINVVDTGNFFRTGPGSRNADNLAHAIVTDLGGGVLQVGFEDIFGGGDQDYNDVVYRFTGVKSVPVPEPTSTLGVVGFAALVAISQRKKLQKASK